MPTTSPYKNNQRKNTGLFGSSTKPDSYQPATSKGIKRGSLAHSRGASESALSTSRPGASDSDADDKSNSVLSLTPEPGEKGLSVSNPGSRYRVNNASSIISVQTRREVQDSSIKLTHADGTERKFYLLSQLNESDRRALEKAHPFVAKKITANKSADEIIEIPRLGQGTFSFVSLAKDEEGLFYAVRAVLNSRELPEQPTEAGVPLVSRGEVLLNTMSEIGVHSFLKEQGLDDSILLMRDAAVVKNPDGVQIYQFLPLADLGNGADIISKASYLSSKEREDLFCYTFLKLITAMIKIHAANIAINDIKPENILFTRAGHISFSDFGAACYIDSHKLKLTSLLSDKRYLAPFSDKPISLSPDVKNRNRRIIESNRNLLYKKQRCDLWSLALTLLEFWEPAMVEDFCEAAVTRRYSPLVSSSPPVRLSLFRPAPSDYSIPVSAGEVTASINSQPQPELPAVDQVIVIYKQELQRHIFNSPAFSKLPSDCQKLFRLMLGTDAEINTKESLIDMLSSFTDLPGFLTRPAEVPDILAKMFGTPISFTDENGSILAIFNKFLTIPNRTFNPDLFHAIKSEIQRISEKLPVIKPVQNAFEKSTPGEFVADVSPVIQHVRLSLHETDSDIELERVRRFLDILDSLCQGNLPYESIFNSLISLSSDLNNSVYTVPGL